MTILAGGAKYPFFKFEAVGSKVSGRVIEFREVQETKFQSTEGATYPNGDPIMGLHVTLETVPGDEDSRVILGIQGKRMKEAARKAIADAGAGDITPQSDLSMQWVGYDGPAHTWLAEYAAFDPAA